jgi:predicted PurR-regulated permease PerM
MGQTLGCVGGVIVGLVVARVLPFIYPIFSANVLDLIFGPGVSTLRDGFNSLFMTGCTCLSSFAVALVVSLAFSRRKQKT